MIKIKIKNQQKKTRTNESKSFKDQITESLYPLERISADLDIEEMLLKIDNDKINNLSKKLKKGLPANEYNEIIDDINKLDKNRKKRIEKIKKTKEKLNTKHL